jgi:hypothetical protein
MQDSGAAVPASEGRACLQDGRVVVSSGWAGLSLTI